MLAWLPSRKCRHATVDANHRRSPMTSKNSYAEYVLGVLNAQLDDCALAYPALTKEFSRDKLRLRSAIESRGVRFALDVLPAARKHLDKCVAQQRLTLFNLAHHAPYKRGSTIPRLFKGLYLRVFDRSGVLKPDADATALKYLRQLLGAVRKLKLDCDIGDRCEAVAEFFRTDAAVHPGTLTWANRDGLDLTNLDAISYEESARDECGQACLFDMPATANVPFNLARRIQQVADYVSSKVGSFDPGTWRFKHGPGAVSDQQFGSYRYEFECWPDRLERVFPYADFAHANYVCAIPDLYTSSPVRGFQMEPPAKLHAVPKSITTPRLIAAEPVALQWCQQAVRDFLYTRVAESVLGNFVDFRRQGLNGDLALAASRSGSHATIDLSSASDRISPWHIERLFRRSPTLLEALQATRSVWIRQDIDKKSPKFYKLRKFSTMGNAVTFPVQSLFFLTVALACLLETRKARVSDRFFKSLGKGEVRVFGDDIIVPKDCAEMVVQTLEALGLKVNTNKTFLNGEFRESCGVDAFRGHDVTTVSILDLPERTRPGSIVSSVDVHNNLCEEGYMHTARYIQKTVARIVSNKIQYVSHGSGAFGWSNRFGDAPTNCKIRYGRRLDRVETKALHLRVSETRKPPKGVAALLQYFTEVPLVVSSAVSTLGYLAQRPKTSLVLGWVAQG